MIRALLTALVLVVLIALIAYTAKPIETAPSNNREIAIDTLFTHDGCTVYRFEDNARYHYYTRCASTVTTDSAHIEFCGKGCSKTVSENIQTEIRNGS